MPHPTLHLSYSSSDDSSDSQMTLTKDSPRLEKTKGACDNDSCESNEKVQMTLTQYIKSHEKQEKKSYKKIKYTKITATKLFTQPEETDNQTEEEVEVTTKIEELLMTHFKGHLSKDDISDWDMDPQYTNSTFQCPIPKEKKCAVCEKLCFSTELRGEPPKSKDWFLDKHMDSATDYHQFHFYSIRYKFLRFCLPNELKLRNITRESLYNDLINRFRGFYNYEEKDVIDIIMKQDEWYDLKYYFDWKQKFDVNFRMEWLKCNNGTLYCSGCGLLCSNFYDKETNTCGQKCSDGSCVFLYETHKEFARVMPKGTESQWKHYCEDEARIRRINRELKNKTIPEKGHEAY